MKNSKDAPPEVAVTATVAFKDSSSTSQLQQQKRPPSRSANQSRNELHAQTQQPQHLRQSESLNNLINSSALESTIELCEAFVIMGAHEAVLQRTLSQAASSNDVSNDSILDRNSAFLSGFEEDILLTRHSLAPHRNEALIKSSPQILDSYPRILRDDKQAEFLPVMAKGVDVNPIKEQFIYLSSINLITFPEGYFIDTEVTLTKLQELSGHRSTAQTSQIKRGPDLPYKIMHYTITQSTGVKKYLTSLSYKEVAIVTFGEGKQKKRKAVIMPKSLCFVSKLPIFTIQKYFIPCNPHRQMLECIYDDPIRRFQQVLIEDFISTEQNPASFLTYLEKKIESAKKTVKLEKLEFYISAFFHHLRIDGSNLEIELYKKASITDANTPRQVKKSIVKYVNTFNKECLRLENYEFKLLFQKIKPKMLLQMFVSLLHERKIIIIHNDISKNAVLIEALISLLYPLQWNFTNISYLIPSMVEYLEAPFPYIVGVPRELWKYIYEQRWEALGEEVVAFDIDNHRIYEKEELPQFPQPYTQLLIKQLEIQLEKSKQLAMSEDSRREEERFWNNFTLKVKQQFLNFLIFLINTFENFYVTPTAGSQPINNSSSTNEKTTAASIVDLSQHQQPNTFFGQGSANDIFNFDLYVQNVTENQGFFEKFVRTQAFINFIEQAYYEEQGNLSDASIRFFKECTRKLSKENIMAVRNMQDTMIQGLMHKFNERSISYSIDKCHLVYEQTLKLRQITSNEKNSKSSADHYLGLITKLDESRIIKMKPFDPRVLIEKRYSKGHQETIYTIQNHIHLKQETIDSKTKGGIKKTNSFYNEFMKDLAIEAPPDYNAQSKLTLLGNPIQSTLKQLTDLEKKELLLKESELHDTSLDNREGQERVLQQYQDQEINRESLSKTVELIRIEDDDQEASADSSSRGSPSPLDEKHQPGLFGFFKKTFSSVKKTFEKTFNQKDLKAKSQSRPTSQNQIRAGGSNTPAFDHFGPSKDNQTPQQISRRARNQGGNIRAARSQTFHSGIAEQKPPLSSQAIALKTGLQQSYQTLQKAKNELKSHQGSDSKDNVRVRDRKNNNSFFANLLNIGGSNQKRNEVMSPSKMEESETQELKTKTLDQRKEGNRSGFFIFNEEDMKSMTQMSPKQQQISYTTRQRSLINVTKSFHFDQVQGNLLSYRQQPIIRSKIPLIDNSNKQSALANRIRSISHQTDLKQRIVHSVNAQRPSLKLMDLINESVGYSQIVEELPSQQNELFDLQASHKITFAVNTDVLQSPVGRSEQDVFNFNQTNTNATANFNLMAKSLRQTPTVASGQRNGLQSAQMSSRKKDIDVKEFEEIYKKSTENLFLIPPTRNLESGYKEKFNIWKSQSSKIDLSLAPSVIALGAPSSKPPKGHNKVLVKKATYNAKGLVNLQTNLSSRFTPGLLSKQSISPKVKNIQCQKDETLLQHKQSLNSELYNEKNSTDEEQKAPIVAKNLSQFKKVTQASSKPFDKQMIHSSLQSNLGGGKKGSKHKRQTSNGLIQLKGEIAENIEPDDDTRTGGNTRKAMENMQVGRLRKKSNGKVTTTANSYANKQSNGTRKFSSVQSTTKQSTQKNNYTSSGQPLSSLNNQAAPSKKPGEQDPASQKTTTKNKDDLMPALKSQEQKLLPEGSAVVGVSEEPSSDVQNESNEKKRFPTALNDKITQQQINARNAQSGPSSYSSCPSKSSIASSNPTEMLSSVQNPSKLDRQKSTLKIQEKVCEVILSEEHFQSIDSESQMIKQVLLPDQSTNSIDLRDSKKGQILRLNSQHEMASPKNQLVEQKNTVPLKETPQASQAQVSQFRMHSLSQQQPQHSQLFPYSQGMRPQFLGLKFGEIQADQAGEHSEQPRKLSSGICQDDSGISKLNISSASKNVKPPLNKITWEAFNQIAKLSGDLDHEPHTPRSGAGQSENEEEDIDE